jgi:hypothetical protein
MEKLSKEKTKNTPEILLDPESGLIELSGKSYPENTFEIYEPVMNWLKEYFDGNAKDKTIVNIAIDYFNSSSSKNLYDFFDLLNNAVFADNQIEVNWIYDEEDESAEEDGEDFRDEFEALQINLVTK